MDRDEIGRIGKKRDEMRKDAKGVYQRAKTGSIMFP